MASPTLQYIFHNFGRFHLDLTVLNVAIKTIGLSTHVILLQIRHVLKTNNVKPYESSGQFGKVRIVGLRENDKKQE